MCEAFLTADGQVVVTGVLVARPHVSHWQDSFPFLSTYRALTLCRHHTLANTHTHNAILHDDLLVLATQ